jgi:hypothetical protein
MLCDASAPADGGPDAAQGVVEGPPFTYTVVWRHPAACPTFEAGQTCPATPTPAPAPGFHHPRPTASQLAYSRSEIRALIHFNMATFAGDGDPGCNAANWNDGVNSSNPATFAPMKVDPAQVLRTS